MMRASRRSYRRRAIHAPTRKAASSDRKGALIVTSRNCSAHRIAGSEEGEWTGRRLSPAFSVGLFNPEVRPMPSSFANPEASVIAEASFMSMQILLSNNQPGFTLPRSLDPAEPIGWSSYGGSILATYMIVEDPAAPLP
ncbi:MULTISPECIES: hypothetical protein [Bradyrhizobium]|nr:MULTISPECIES: hypothetical protein [Bradyrhizobium]QOG20180.1 hypothetical protein FOM02_25340 [Bradyrhizobium sp. SEMIA]UFW52503.1 hypothetical protein BaraCB756_16540 [Bradyrhizobium arachidis]